MNTQLWQELQLRLGQLIDQHALPWQVAATEERNAPQHISAGTQVSLVGLHCILRPEQALYLRPMMEQQNLGSVWRIYFGLMWSSTPAPAQLTLPAVIALKKTLEHAGFKSNENYLAWQWTALHPRRQDFLLRYAQQPEKTLADTEAIFNTLLITHQAAIEQANAALKTAPSSLAASLNQLRDELI